MRRSPAAAGRGLTPARALCAAAAAVGVCSVVFAALLQPVLARDNDLWFHMNMGRFIAAHRALPASSFFSFLQPPRPAADYAWLFDALVFSLHSAGGYAALVVLRTLALAATLYFTLSVLGLEDGDSFPSASTAALVGVYAAFLFWRGLLVRPHIASYLFIPLCVWALERGGRRLYLLPAIGLLWGNLHGIEYPVPVLIGCAYAAQALLFERRGPERDRRLAFSALLAACPFLTPLGARLVALPFTPMPYNQIVVSEGAAVAPADLLRLSLNRGMPSWETLSNVLLGLSVVSAAVSLYRRDVKPARLILLAGGVYLALHANRLREECVLLCVGVLAGRPQLGRLSAPGAWAAALAAALVAALPAKYAWRETSRWAAWPLSRHGLPVGVADYLLRFGGTGEVLNHSDQGGYLEWTLWPRFTIAGDMQTPFLFTDEDLLEVTQAFSDPAMLGALVDRYHPDFIAAPFSAKSFPTVIRTQPRYALVFYDDSVALYADRWKRPRLAADRLVFGDPFEAQPVSLPEPSGRGGAAKLPAPLVAMIRIDPGCLKTRWRAARLCAQAGDEPCLLEQGEAIRKAYPESAFGWMARGVALRGLGRADEARASLRRSLALAPDPVRPAVEAELAAAKGPPAPRP